MFSLHERLAADTFEIMDLPLSQLLLLNDQRYPWMILVPRIEGVTEIHHLDNQQRLQLMQESCELAEYIEQHFNIDKMNVAVLGNIVPQLHMHHIGRRQDDPAWPGPVWGHSSARPYSAGQADALIEQTRMAFSGYL